MIQKISWKSLLKHLFFAIKILISGILLAIILRVFVLSSFKVPTGSMEPAIFPGDYILVNKLVYGARIVKNFDFMKGGKFETFRIKGFGKIKKNDVMVFNFPYTNPEKLEPDLNVFLVKRCKGLPGDTVRVKNGNYKYSGSLYLPKANDKLVIDTTNYQLYKPLIEYETDKIMEFKENSIYLDKTVLNNYTFKMNYYFMAGDNTFNSRDSRYWGLVPEDHIVGKATLIWQSKNMNTGKRRWDRTCKIIQ